MFNHPKNRYSVESHEGLEGLVVSRYPSLDELRGYKLRIKVLRGVLSGFVKTEDNSGVFFLGFTSDILTAKIGPSGIGCHPVGCHWTSASLSNVSWQHLK